MQFPQAFLCWPCMHYQSSVCTRPVMLLVYTDSFLMMRMHGLYTMQPRLRIRGAGIRKAEMTLCGNMSVLSSVLVGIAPVHTI